MPDQSSSAPDQVLRYLISEAQSPVAMFDAKMCYLSASQRWMELYTPGIDPIGRSHYDIFPNLPERWKEVHRRGLAGERLREDEDHWVMPDGSEQWMRWTIYPWRESSGAIGGIVISVEDITQRVLVERNLRFHENLLEETGHIAKVGGWEFEVSTGRGHWTREVALIHEVDPECPTSRDFGLSFYSPDSRPRLEAALHEAISDGVPYDLELEIITARGNRRWVRTIAHPVFENSAVVRVRGSIQDITERRASEKVLRRQASLLEQSYDAILVWELGGDIVDWNAGAERLYGFRKQEAIGNSSHLLLKTSFTGDMDLVSVLHRLAQDEHWEGQLHHVSKSGKQLLVESRMVRILEGSRAYVLETNRDITEKHQLEEQLRQSQKMEAIGRLAGGIAHDFNNLLGVIIGCTELLADTQDLEEVHRRSTDIQKAAQRAANLTRQLLSYSRKQILRPQILDPRSKLRDMLDMLSRLVGEDVHLRLDLSDERGNLRIDPTQLEQIVLNLVVNAREAMPQGGKILIEARNVEFDESLVRTHFAISPGCYFMLAVADTGMGMDPETRKHIFEPFFTTKQGGTGLGLATVYGAVKQSGGTIWVYSEPGHGTTFRVYFPIAEGLAVAPPDPAPIPLPAASGETIFVVEDSDSLREVTLEFLRTAGYNILSCGDPVEALLLATLHSGPIQLLLTDVIMPHMNGRELAARLQGVHPETRVLFMSGYAGDALVNQGVLEEGIALLVKPFTRSALMKKIQELLVPVS